jgi:hypothetical protein
MKDEVLGELSPSERFPEELEGAVLYRGNSVSISIDPDGEDILVSLSLARSVIAAISKYDAIARSAAAKDLLGAYNNNWREYEKATEKGLVVAMSDPKLSGQEFADRLTLTSVRVLGDTCELGYNDGGLFAGHWIFVTARDGAKFEDLSAQLFG